MDCQEYNIREIERVRGQHLQLEDRGAIQALHRQGLSQRKIAQAVNCCPTTVGNELKRGTASRKSNRGRAPEYSARRGQAAYQANRKHSHRHKKLLQCKKFVDWVVKQFWEQHWSLDSSAGYAKRHQLFAENEMMCSKTLYQALWRSELPLSLTDMPEVLKRKRRRNPSRKNKRVYGASIDERPVIAAQRIEVGHWEGDTLIGKRAGREAVVLSLLEKKTQNYIALLIQSKTSSAVMAAMNTLQEEYGERFADVFKTITFDNGSEFSDAVAIEQWGTKVFFAHPYTSWERSQNERHNGLFRFYVPKGDSMAHYSADYILASADSLNGRPRKKLGYCTPEELFDAFLDQVYAA